MAAPKPGVAICHFRAGLLNCVKIQSTMKYCCLLSGLIIIMTACSPVDTERPLPTPLSSALDTIKAEYAPDKRVAIWNVSAEQAGEGFVVRGETNLPDALEALQAQLADTGLQLDYQINMLPDTSLGRQTYGIVNLSACNIRSEGKHSAELATQSTLGTPLRIYKKVDGWYYVQTPDGYLGWLDSDGFTLTDKTGVDNWKSAEKRVYMPEFGFSYAAPSTDAPYVSDLTAGNILQAAGEENGYEVVRYPDGRKAYLPSGTTMDYQDWLASTQPQVDNILATAETFLGRPYLWGGTSGKGVDCSGFTKTVFYLNGAMLPRDASQQVHVGQLVETDTATLVNLVPGDLLFFGRAATAEQKEKITHVAIYQGDGRIIHSSGMVKTESLRRDAPDFNEYRLQTFIRAKRVLPADPELGVFPLQEVSAYQ